MSSKTGTVYIHSGKADVNKKSPVAPLSKKPDGLDELAERAGMIIYELVSSRPLIFPFRDKLTICPNRITLTNKSFFSSDEYPMPIENVTNAKVYQHLFWGSLEIETFGIPKPPIIKNLSINSARLARRYILALIECKKNNIDLSGLGIEQLKEKLKQIGMVQFKSDQKGYHDI